jgi:hypothetical protein
MAFVMAAGVCLALLGSHPAAAANFVGQTVRAQGDVHILRNGADMMAGSGTALQLGDVIKTGPGARLRLRFIDGSILSLGENTTLSIDIFSIDAANHSRTVQLTMPNGIVDTSAAKSGESQFDYAIKTTTAYSAVRGTKWIVQQAPASTAVYVLSGTVEFGSTVVQSPPAFVNAGQWGSLDAQGRMSALQPTTPGMLQSLLQATGDTSGGGGSYTPSPTPSEPAPAPMPMPSLNLPVFPTQPVTPAYPTPRTNGSNGGGYGGRGTGNY